MTSSRKNVVLLLVCFIVSICILHRFNKNIFLNNKSETIFTVETLLLEQQKAVLVDAFDYNLTTCSERAFNRGTNQKVFSFSFYGDMTSSLNQVRDYFEGIEENLKIINQSYPGHLMRLYVDVASEHLIWKELKDMMDRYSNLDVCDVNSLPGFRLAEAHKMFPMIWRFFPTLDPQVDIFLSRDLDSRISVRETAAVSEFLNSGLSLHSMRDHPSHSTYILGGAWGSKLTANIETRSKWAQAWQGMMNDNKIWSARSAKGPDQILLSHHVWRVFEGAKNTLQHDAYLCAQYKGSVAWPTQRLIEPHNFVGSVYKDNITLIRKCPHICRPKNRPQWEYC